MCPVECVVFVDIHVEVSILIDENYLGEYRLPKHGSGRFLFWFAFFILLIFCLFVCFMLQILRLTCALLSFLAF